MFLKEVDNDNILQSLARFCMPQPQIPDALHAMMKNFKKIK